MLSGLLFWLSPARRSFMRRLARPGLARFRASLDQCGSESAVRVLSILLQANAEFLAYALSRKGPLKPFAAGATPDTVEACLAALLIYSANLFLRDEMAKNESEMIPLLAQVVGTDPKHVMLMRDNLRKAPRSEEWLLFTRLAQDLGAARPEYDAELERSFGYQYLSYVDQYRPMVMRELERVQLN
ncbi:MAG TPA: hypothetical protein VIX59_19000 [Candidatus Binataceae bacterium]